MPFIRRYICANPIECPSVDRKMRKLWNVDRNLEAIYYFPSYMRCRYNIDAHHIGW